MSGSTRTALLVMDVQQVVVDGYVSDPSVLERINAAIGHARRSDVLLVFVAVGFRPGHPEVSPLNKAFGRMLGGERLVMGAPGTELHPSLDRSEDDLVVTKRRVSAFAGSDLEEILRAGGIGHVVLSGIATSGVVLSTLREAADRDYELTVLSDACVDAVAEVHEMLIGVLFPQQAKVVTVAEWISA